MHVHINILQNRLASTNVRPITILVPLDGTHLVAVRGLIH